MTLFTMKVDFIFHSTDNITNISNSLAPYKSTRQSLTYPPHPPLHRILRSVDSLLLRLLMWEVDGPMNE